MALSEYEQKVLSELEYSLFAQDPHFEEGLNGKRIFDQRRRILHWGLTTFFIGSVCLVTFFTSSTLISLLSLATMFVSSIAVLSSLRTLKRVRNAPSSYPSVRSG